MDVSYLDDLAKTKNGVEYLIVSQDPLQKAMNAKKNENKQLRETFRAFLTMTTKRIDSKNDGSTS